MVKFIDHLNNCKAEGMKIFLWIINNIQEIRKILKLNLNKISCIQI